MVLQYKVGGIFLLRLNISDRPIGNKYLEGKLKRTLKPANSRAEGRQAEAGATAGRRQAASMLELLLVGCSSVVVLLHGASLFLRALFAPRPVVARPISFLGFVA